MKKSAPSEHAEQKALVKKLRKLGIVFFAVPNGADVEYHHRRRLIDEGLEPGVSDLVILGKNKVLFLEMKRRKGGSWSTAQKKWKKRVEALGFQYEVAKGAKDAWEKIEPILSLLES